MGFLVISALILCGIISALVLYHAKRKRLYELASKFPGPPTVPLLGNALDFLGSNEDNLKRMVEYAGSYSSPFRVWLGPNLLIFISKPEDVQKVLSSDKLVEKARVYKFMLPWLGIGLFSAPAKIWRIHRKLIGPTFNLKIIESFVEIFATQSKIFVDQLKSKIDGPEFQVSGYVSLLTLDVICESTMGVKIGAQTETRNRNFMRAVEEVLATVYERMFKAWLHPDVTFHLSKVGKKQEECVKILHSFTNDVIRSKMEALDNRDGRKNGDIEYDDGSSEPKSRRNAYLDLLMKLTLDKKKMSKSQLCAEVNTMLSAGSETTATVTTSVFLMLASFQNVQDKVYEELCEIYGSYVDDIDKRSVTHEDLPRMKYTERVIKETMRLLPVTNFFAREITEDFTLGEHTLPKGCMVAIDMLAAHRSESQWPNPLKFDPDRFLPEEIAKRNPYCYLPFSVGPRNCIGSRFAMMEMKAIVATVLRKYILKKDNVIPIKDMRLKAGLILTLVEPVKVRIVRRPTSRVR